MLYSAVVVLVILDGWGVSRRKKGNAIALARTPVFSRLWTECPHTTLIASGEAVGLPPGLAGNSEVGHLNLGAGRIVPQPIVKIDQAIAAGDFYANRALMGAMRHVQKNNSALHLLGLVSDGRVHSSMEHIYALLEMARQNRITRVFVHANLDGRDTPPRSAEKYLRALEEKMRELKLGRIATVGGRYYGMDRDSHWERVRLFYDACVHGRGFSAPSALQAVRMAYARGESDEFVKPTVISSGRHTSEGGLPAGEPAGLIRDGAAVIAFNFRPERMREITRLMTDPAFDEMRDGRAPNIHYVCMTSYGSQFDLPVAFRSDGIPNVLARVLSNHGIRQLHVAETEKYAHVTFYFNGGEEVRHIGEDWVLVPSPRVESYATKPEMSARKVTQVVVDAIRSRDYRFILVNFANADMVGHTGVFNAAVRAVEVVDECLGRILAAAERTGATCLVTADHGNADEMADAAYGEVHTAHSANPVPFIIACSRAADSVLPAAENKRERILADVAPTVLQLLQIKQPPEMTGRSLIAL